MDQRNALASLDPQQEEFRHALERLLIDGGQKGNVEAEIEHMIDRGFPGLHLPRHLFDGIDR